MENENIYDLFWYAFNYRNASTQDADKWYSELQDCVDRLIERGESLDKEQ